jgi:hypothetical protein
MWLALGVVVVAVLVPSLADAERTRRKARVARRAAVPPRPPLVAAFATWPRREVLDLAVRAWRCAREAGQVDGRLLTVIDYSLPSTERRLWVLDPAARRILFHELVAHGEGSGEILAAAFSNRPHSRQSSLGLFRTEDVYRGRHGDSLRLSGLEPGVNDRAMERAIVLHGAAYVTPAIAATGRLGRSWGCPAVDRRVHRRLIATIKGGTAVFAYYPEARWLAGSPFLRCDVQLTRAE